MLKRLKHLYLLINAMREMQSESYPMDSFHPLTMAVLQDAVADVRFIASEFSPMGWEEGLRRVLSHRPRTASRIIYLDRILSSGEVDNPVRASSLLGTALPLLREFYYAVRERLDESEQF